MKQFKKISILTSLLCLSFIAFSQTGAIRINQLGYYPTANKIAVVVNTQATTFELIQAENSTVVYSGNLTPMEYWNDAGDSIKRCDFSAFTTLGNYKIRIPDFGESYTFAISDTVLRKAAYASLKSYYYQRVSFELEEEYAGLWARAAGHPDTVCIFHESTGKTGEMSSPGGWYDAGDFGKYVINAGISVGTMLSFYESFDSIFADGTIHIPESDNGKNDLLDEVKYELDWLKTMQDDDGGVFFKLTTLNFQGTFMPSAATASRYVIGKSTSSALDFAAMMAMAGRIYDNYDSIYAADCIVRAGNAWNWAKANPEIYFTNPSDVNTGQYGDGNVTDEFIWAAAELYISTQEDEFKTYLEGKSDQLTYQSGPWWGGVRPLASLSLVTVPNGLSVDLINTIKNSLTSTADDWLDEIATSPCRIPDFTYNWGSNSGIANIGVGLLYSYLVTKDEKYIRGAAECADYLLGKNATGFSFQSSYGYKTPMNFHHRASGADGIPQPVPGFIAGGPNSGQQDGERYPFNHPAKSYVDVYGSYASNEVCINWNSPFTVLLGGVDAILGSQEEVDFEVPLSVNNPPDLDLDYPTYDRIVDANQAFSVRGSATDPDGISKVELYIDVQYLADTTSGEFEWPLTSLTTGSHSLTILAYDSLGLTSEATHPFTYIPFGIVPGKVEAEDYSDMTGISTETTSDTDGGLNITSISNGDWLDYYLDVKESGSYRVEFRVASSSGGGKYELRKEAGTLLSSGDIEATGGEQLWTTIADTFDLSRIKQTVRLKAVEGGWSINWINFIKLDDTSIDDHLARPIGFSLDIKPNPVNDVFTVNYKVKEQSPVEFKIYDMKGRLMARRTEKNIKFQDNEFEWIIDGFPASGIYYLSMYQGGSMITTSKLFIQK